MFGDDCGSGLSGWAFYELGRGDAAASRNHARVADALAARLRGGTQADVGALIAENQSLWQQNQALLQQNRALAEQKRDVETAYTTLASDEARLRAWAEEADAALRGRDAGSGAGHRRDKGRLKRDLRAYKK